jgi:hypothetical protein
VNKKSFDASLSKMEKLYLEKISTETAVIAENEVVDAVEASHTLPSAVINNSNILTVPYLLHKFQDDTSYIAPVMEQCSIQSKLQNEMLSS